MMNNVLVLICLVLCSFIAGAQPSYSLNQKMYPRATNSIRTKEDILKKQFLEAGLRWDAAQIFIRSFKYDGQLEVWVRNNTLTPFKLFKTYKVCAMAGALGPKRMEGDYQVPEGFYYINKFNPKSTYHLSLGINYPNASDLILSDPEKPGSGIYIHGSCVTTGCIPLQDDQIEELYLIAANANSNGQDFIPVHIYPVRFSDTNSEVQLKKAIENNAFLGKFSKTLKEVYNYFEKERKLPLVTVNAYGEYGMLL